MRERSMSRSRVFACLLLALMLVLTVSPAAFAEVQYYTGEEAFSGSRDATVFQAGARCQRDGLQRVCVYRGHDRHH